MDGLLVKWFSLSNGIFNYRTCIHIAGNGLLELFPKSFLEPFAFSKSRSAITQSALI